MDWKSKWSCKCGAIWTSMDESPPFTPEDLPGVAVCPTCSGPLTRMPDRPLLTDAWTAILGPEKPRG